MSSPQQTPVDLIQFSDKTMDSTNDKHNSDIVQKMVINDSASSTLIATAVAKLTTSALTPSIIVINKSESDSYESAQLVDAALTAAPATSSKPPISVTTATSTTTATNTILPAENVQSLTQVCIREKCVQRLNFWIAHKV